MRNARLNQLRWRDITTTIITMRMARPISAAPSRSGAALNIGFVAVEGPPAC